MNCIAIDDEPKALEIIERYCQKSNLIHLKGLFREPLKAIEFLNKENIDLVFLDINMPDINGLQLIQTLSTKPMVIFTTAYSNYAVESYSLNAVDYLLKPITFDRFLVAANKASNQFLLQNKSKANDNDADAVYIKSGPHTHRIKISEILYLEKEGNYITIHLKNKQILIRENMGDVFDLVPSAEFARVHKSFVVAIKHISMIEVHQLIVNTTKIPIGSTYREAFRIRLGLK